MSPGGRRGRIHGSSEEGRLRDLSPETTLRAFTQRPMPFDTARDEYRIFACIESLTAAERDLGARVAKAAQRLKSWCAEIEQWGWSGSFEQPSEQFREARRKSIERRIREHVADTDPTSTLPPLEYWGSLLSVEVEQHEARLDDMEEEMLKLDVEELKEHVLDMHPAGKSRPSSSGYEASRQSYRLMDDFSFLITQTLLSALPHHAQLKDRLNTWTARVSILRAAPRFVDELHTAQKALQLGWDAIEPPSDDSDLAFAQWKEAVDTISSVLHSKVADLGQRLDRMLDTLEGREDCLPDNWIDIFEGAEADYGRWAHESRRRVIELEVRRKGDKTSQGVPTNASEQDQPRLPQTISNHVVHSNSLSDSPARTEHFNAQSPGLAAATAPSSIINGVQAPSNTNRDLDGAVAGSRTMTAHKVDLAMSQLDVKSIEDNSGAEATPGYGDAGPLPLQANSSGTARLPGAILGAHLSDVLLAKSSVDPAPLLQTRRQDAADERQPRDPASIDSSTTSADSPDSFDRALTSQTTIEPEPDFLDDGSEFDEGDTVVHNDLDDIPEDSTETDSHDAVLGTASALAFKRPQALKLPESPVVMTTDGHDGTILDSPQTPRFRRGSVGSLTSEMSFESSPSGNMEESPSVRNVVNRPLRAPRPELNAAMAKRRPPKIAVDDNVQSTPWPPTRFTQKPVNSTEDLERKISDILTTIPAHIRLTSGPSADSPEVKSARGVAVKGSRGYLRAARSVSGLKSPELTLSPAKNDDSSAASGRKSAAAARMDNDIKLYHLTQPGKDQPVKLFIRRVGENGERVMVRVGGGWADLGEYLRQYAEHHGRRTASDGKFEILGLEVKGSDNSPNRPESAMARRDRHFSSSHMPASPTSTTPSRPSALGLSNNEAPPHMPSFTSTPGTAEETSIPSTNSSQRSWQGNEVGLAGPKSKKLDLSGQKLEWIEGMMKQARTVSGSVITASQTPFQRDEPTDARSESRSDSRASTRAGSKKPEFGDLGKIGGTKRIFLKGGKPVAE